MSKMGAEFEKNLDKYKYDLYEALKQIVAWMEKWNNAEWEFDGLLIDGRKAMAKVEGLASKK